METEDQVQDQVQQEAPPEDDIAALKSRLAEITERNSALEQKLGHVATNLEAITRANYARAVKAVRAEMKAAVESGDTERFNRAEQAEQELQQQIPAQQPNSNQAFADWHQRNSWYGKDAEASEFANTLAPGIKQRGFVEGSPAFFEEIGRLTRRQFPNKFRPQSAAPSVEGAGQTGRTKGGKGEADMPPGWEAVADRFIAKNPKAYPNGRKDYVASYWKHNGEQNAA